VWAVSVSPNFSVYCPPFCVGSRVSSIVQQLVEHSTPKCPTVSRTFLLPEKNREKYADSGFLGDRVLAEAVEGGEEGHFTMMNYLKVTSMEEQTSSRRRVNRTRPPEAKVLSLFV
jgi:hypothetical protein